MTTLQNTMCHVQHMDLHDFDNRRVTPRHSIYIQHMHLHGSATRRVTPCCTIDPWHDSCFRDECSLRTSKERLHFQRGYHIDQ